MELALTVMMGLGIFLAIPALFGFAAAGVFLMKERKARKAGVNTHIEKEAPEKETVAVGARLSRSGDSD